jgi:O-antigen ligase
LKELFLKNQQFVVIALIWLVVGMYLGPVVYFLIPAMLILMYNNGMHLEILIGFFFVLILSDSRMAQLQFAATLKNIYLPFVAIITFKEMRNLAQVVNFYKYFTAFFCVAALTILFNPDMSLAFQKTLSYILLLVFIPNYIFIVYMKYKTDFFRSIVFMVSLILVLGVIINYINPGVTNLVGRFRGLLGNPNGLGLFTFLFILLFATLNEHFENLFTRNEKLFVYGLSFFCLLKCGARASLISTLMFFFFRKFYKISPIFGFIIFIIVLLLYQMVSDNLVQIIIALGLGDEFRVETLETGSGRVIAWKFAWDQIQDNFYLGNGFSYNEYLFRKNYDYLSRLGHEGMAHNSYLTFWLDTGIIGLLLFLIGLLTTFLKAAKLSRLAIPVLYSVLFSNYYESWITASLNPFTIQLLFILTVIFIYDFKYKETADDELKPDEKSPKVQPAM